MAQRWREGEVAAEREKAEGRAEKEGVFSGCCVHGSIDRVLGSKG